MKKILLASAMLLFAGLSAQTNFGVKGGYVLSTLNSNEGGFGEVGAELKSKSGFYIGALVEHKLNDKFALQGEVEYANLGGKLELSMQEFGLPGVKVTEKMHFNRILVPISARYYATPELAVYGGPYVSFTTSNKGKIDVSGAVVTNPAAIREEERRLDKFFDDSLKSTDFGLFLGADYKVYKNLFVDARYSFGLTNMIKNPVGGEKLKMNFFQLGVGYKFK